MFFLQHIDTGTGRHPKYGAGKWGGDYSAPAPYRRKGGLVGPSILLLSCHFYMCGRPGACTDGWLGRAMECGR